MFLPGIGFLTLKERKGQGREGEERKEKEGKDISSGESCCCCIADVLANVSVPDRHPAGGVSAGVTRFPHARYVP